MNFPGNAIQTAVYNALTGDVGITALVPAARILDHVPDGTAYPYITIGEGDQVEDHGSHSAPGVSAAIYVHSWSQYLGRKQVKQIMEAIYDRLHEGTLTITGHVFVLCRFEFAEIMKDGDGATHHGVQRFRVITRRT